MVYETKVKTSRIVPFGYAVSEHDDKLLIPIPEELDALEAAMKYLRSSSVRDVTAWLVAKTGRSIAPKNVWLKYQQWKKKKFANKRYSAPETES